MLYGWTLELSVRRERESLAIMPEIISFWFSVPFGRIFPQGRHAVAFVLLSQFQEIHRKSIELFLDISFEPRSVILPSTFVIHRG